MNEKTSQEVITYLIGEVKRLTTELNNTQKGLMDWFGCYNSLMQEYNALYEKYSALTEKMPNNSSKKKDSLEPDFSSVVKSFKKP